MLGPSRAVAPAQEQPSRQGADPQPPLTRCHCTSCWKDAFLAAFGSVGSEQVSSDASVTSVRIAHPATETLVVSLILLAVSSIERLG